MENALNWFEIVVEDLDRATRFYEEVLAVPLRRESFQGTAMSIFPYAQPRGVGGALVSRSEPLAGRGGQIVYLPAEGKLDACLARVAAAGGAVVTPRHGIGPAGFIALVRDSEGNLVGLHSQT
jgi:predicted enzyme related to lactoylglutathione lyase